MKSPFKLLAAIIGCELVGILSTPFTTAAIPTWYAMIQKPSFSPPNWIFGPVWTMLYALMGISAYMIWTLTSKKGLQKKIEEAQMLFIVQLVLNFIWSILFFGLHSPILGLIDIVALWIAIFLTIKAFYPLSKPAAYLLLPYIAWVSFATLLNLAIVILN